MNDKKRLSIRGPVSLPYCWRRAIPIGIILLTLLAIPGYLFISSDNSAMVCYGKLLDQNDRPIANGQINAQVSGVCLFPRLNMLFGREPTYNYTIHSTTRLDGSFKVKGWGTYLAVGVIGDKGCVGGGGIECDYEALSVERFHPDPVHPVIVHAWRLLHPEPLIKGASPLIDGDGKDHGIDLLHNHFADNDPLAQLFIKMTVPPYNDWNRPYDWSYEIKVRDGGAIATKEQYPFIAPENGYKAVIHQEFKNANGQHLSSFRTIYYLKADGGKIYARLDIEWRPSSDGAQFAVDYVANPAGSRDLEPSKD